MLQSCAPILAACVLIATTTAESYEDVDQVQIGIEISKRQTLWKLTHNVTRDEGSEFMLSPISTKTPINVVVTTYVKNNLKNVTREPVTLASFTLHGQGCSRSYYTDSSVVGYMRIWTDGHAYNQIFPVVGKSGRGGSDIFRKLNELAGNKTKRVKYTKVFEPIVTNIEEKGTKSNYREPESAADFRVTKDKIIFEPSSKYKYYITQRQLQRLDRRVPRNCAPKPTGIDIIPSHGFRYKLIDAHIIAITAGLLVIIGIIATVVICKRKKPGQPKVMAANMSSRQSGKFVDDGFGRTDRVTASYQDESTTFVPKHGAPKQSVRNMNREERNVYGNKIGEDFDGRDTHLMTSLPATAVPSSNETRPIHQSVKTYTPGQKKAYANSIANDFK